MDNQDAEFLSKLRAAFQVEAAEHLQVIASGLLELERTQDAAPRRELVAVIFREAHSLKGAARAVNLAAVEGVCQSLESVLAAWRRSDVRPSPWLLDPLHAAVRAIERDLSVPATPGLGSGVRPGGDADDDSNLLRDLARLEATIEGGGQRPEAMGTASLDAAPLATWDDPTGEARPAPGSAALADLLVSPHTPDSDTLGPPIPAPAAGPSPTAGAPPSSSASRPAPGRQETLRVSTSKLDAVLRQAEELLAVKLTSAQRAADVRSLAGGLGLWEKEWAKAAPDAYAIRQWLGPADGRAPGGATGAPASGGRPNGGAANGGAAAAASARLLEFLDRNEAHVRALHNRVAALLKSAEQDRRSAAAMIDALLENSKKLLMFPAATLLEVFPRLVRELSRDQGKDVDLVVSGGGVEVDKRVLEEMKDPLIHLLRNAVDHGIEPPQARQRQGKPPRGTIRLTVAPADGSKVEITVADDGAGIDPARVKAAAVRRGGTSEEEAARLTDDEAVALIFVPEVSTSPILTEISGRGLGMDIVKAKVEKLGGRVEVRTRLGAGTTFRLLLPLTLATFRGILVRSSGQMFVVPTAGVERVVRVKPGDVKSVENRDTLELNGRAVSFVRLADVLELGGGVGDEEPDGAGSGARDAASEWVPVVVLAAGGKRIAFRVDAVLNEQEVLVKRLGAPLSRVRNVAGATVLGSGRPVPVLYVDDLMKSAARRAGAARATGASPGTPDAPAPAGTLPGGRLRILVAEDSITARMLVKNILESAGYSVKTAVDGMDALTLLKTEDFDLVVSDVEMPRMSGFDLTARMRADPRLAEVPVVLVTALASREDRERGVDVGANAYIVKSSFDQSDLLAAVGRLA